MDNHYAYDGPHGQGSPPADIGIYAKQAKKMGLQYHWWKQKMSNKHLNFIIGGENF